MAAGGRARADGLPSGGQVFTVSRLFSLARERNGRGKREREREDEGSDLREKLMFSLESRLSVG